jgi:hypothetical protein
MNCFAHEGTSAVGLCFVCQKGLCKRCVASDTPRVLCRSCRERGTIGFEYKSAASFGNWPLVHISTGLDPLTMRPKVARGVIAIGGVAIGGLAIGGAVLGLFTLGGVSLGLIFAAGGVALGVGLSVGGLAVGSVAVGGLAVGFLYALGGAAFGPAIIDGRRCDDAAREFLSRWLPGALPPSCR